MKINDEVFLYNGISFDQLITQYGQIIEKFPEAKNFQLIAKIDYYESQCCNLFLTFKREETESEKENRLNAEDRENRIRIMNFKREQETLKNLGLI